MIATRWQGVALVVLRTLLGWHFLYEGYYKLMLPAWSSAGSPLPVWSAGGYLRAATGPLAPAFHALAASALAGWIDLAVPIALALVGLSLVLGLFTRSEEHTSELQSLLGISYAVICLKKKNNFECR